MQEIDSLIEAKWIIPVEPRGVVHENCSLAVQNGKIIDLLPSVDASRLYHAGIVHKLSEHVLIPGLVNTHTHAAMSLFRGLADDLPLMEWLQQHIWPAEQKWITDEFVHDGSQLAIAEMLSGGITCFNDMYFYPDVTARAASHAGIRAVVGLIVLDFPTVWASSADEYINKGLELHDHYHGDALIRTAFAPHAPYTVSDTPLQRIKVLADELEIPIHMHVHETNDEVQQSIETYGVRPLQRMKDLAMLSPNLLAVHMTQLTDDEIQMAAEHGIHIVHCPESNLKLASGFCPVGKLLDAGINVALGTDGAASNNDLDMFGEMRTAAMLAKAIAGDPSVVPASVALEMATLNGARALGMEQDIGSLVPGKAADIVAVKMTDIETQPLYHPISQLVYATGRDKVSDVWINGQHLLNQGHLTTLDRTAILHKTLHWRDMIAASDKH